MRIRDVFLRVTGSRPSTSLRAVWGVCVLLLGVPLALTAQGMTPAGTDVHNQATLQYEEPDGTPVTLPSNLVTLVIGQVAGVDLDPPGSAQILPGGTAVFPHVLRSLGNGDDTFTLNRQAPSGWGVAVYADVDGDGLLSSADTLLTGFITLNAGGVLRILAVVQIPEAASPGLSGTIVLTAQSHFDGSVTDTVQDTVTVAESQTIVALEKSVDHVLGSPGDVLLYTVRYRISGAGSLSDFRISDQIPLQTVYLPGSLRRETTALTDAQDGDSGTFDAGANRVVFSFGTVSAGDEGSFTFQVQLPESVAEGSLIQNQARADFQTESGAASTLTEVVETTVAFPELSMEKRVTAPDPATDGDEVTYTIVLRNESSGLTARDLLVTDTLPQLLDLQEALPSTGFVVEGRTLAWTLPNLAPGDSTVLTIRALVVAETGNEEVAANWAYFSSVGGTLGADSARAIPLVFGSQTSVALEKSVDLNRAAPGDTLTYTLRYSVIGTGAVNDLRISDQVSSQVVYLPGSLRFGSTALSDAHDGDSGTSEAGENRVLFSLGTVSAGESGSFTFKVQLRDSAAAGSLIQNQARADFQTDVGADSTFTEVVETAVSFPELSLEKTVAAPDSATDGDEVSYTIILRNQSVDLTARGLQVTDTLPELLQLQEALPSTDLSVSGRTLSWAIPDLAPGDSTVLTLRALVTAENGDEEVASNWAYCSSASGEQAADSSRAIPIFSDEDEDLEPGLALRLTSEALEVSLGEQVPMRVELLNDGDVSLDGLSVFLELPEGSRWVDREIFIQGGGSAALSTTLPGQTGMFMSLSSGLAVSGDRVADSVRVNGPLVEVYLPGQLMPGDSLFFHYVMAVVSTPSQIMETRATALGSRAGAMATDEEAVASNEEVSWVRTRRNRALETRTLIGKVWIDLNQDGLQTEDELGVPGVDIWTEDGELVTTDQVGKFSFVNLRPGRHGLRVDPLTLPLGYRVAGEGVSADLRFVEVNGWVSPRVSFALVPGPVAACPVPVPGPVGSEGAVSLPGANGAMAELQAAGDEGVAGSVNGGARGAMDGDDEAISNGHSSATEKGTAPEPPQLMILSPDGWRPFADPIASPSPTGPAPDGIPPLRTEEDRAEDRGQAFLKGPGVEIFHPADGAVLDRDRLFVGVEGEAGQAVSLFVGDSLISEATTRADGIHDFIAVPLETGPQTIRVRLTNSWGTERWDSLRVHVSGLPHQVVFEDQEVRMEADGHSRYPLSFLLLDAWGVPVVQGPYATVQVRGADIVSVDTDPSSVGHQAKADARGWASVVLQSGREVGEGHLTVASHEAQDTLYLQVRPSVRSLLVVGVGSVSLGAGPEAFGAVTARGRIGTNTSMTLSYDTRRLDQGRDEFGRSTDPLGEGEYAILGDASEKRSIGASRYAFAARVERNRDWLAVGDLQTANFADGLTLSRYTRALSGAAAQVETGLVTWKGFGALTTQTLRQAQIRGDGSSGPYLLGTDILPGTERVTLEVRAHENATRVVSQQGLQRFVDYQIDYQHGTLLLKRPVPAADAYGNPVFLMVTYEADGGGSRSAVWGVRATSDLSRMPGLGSADLIPMGLTFVQDDLALGRYRLLGADLGLSLGGRLTLKAEVARAESPDSTDVAAQVEGTLSLFDGSLDLSGRWLRIGDEFRNPANRGLLGGTEEVRVGAGLTVLDAKVLLAHQRQEFESRDLNRSQTLLNVSRDIRSGLRLQLQASRENVTTQGMEDDGGAGQVKLTWNPHPRVSLWSEGRRQLWSRGDALATGDFVGVGGSLEVTSGVSLEARHLRVSPRGDRDTYSLTSLGVRSELASGARAWGSYQLSGGISGPSNAAVLGLSHRIQLGSSWTVNGLVERRHGVQQAPLGDNVLALPFGGQEEDYWSTGLGVEHLPTDAPYRLSAKGEMRNGANHSNRSLSVAGDVSFNSSLALLSRQELVWTERVRGDEERESQRLWSLWGMAFRPFHSDALNALAKVEWREDKDPGGVGVLNTPGRDRRLIATGEVIWAPSANWELSGRYSMRSARNTVVSGSATQDLSVRTTADYAGAKGELKVSPWLGFRMDLRLLNERSSSTTEWDVAPSILLNLAQGIELQGGYRFGGLQDPDFAVRGGEGWFLTIGTRITEGTLSNVAGFWRSRLDHLPWQR